MADTLVSDAVINPSRRYLLLGTLGVSAAGAVATAIPFVKAWEPSAKARALGAPVKVDISKLLPGEILGPIPAWRGQPVFVIRRTETALDQLSSTSTGLRDPNSDDTRQQPDYAQNSHRSRLPEIGVYLGLCTHLGCSPKYYSELQASAIAPEWTGGFFCPCHGSRFDLAGRVEVNFPAPTNLVVPPHMYESEKLIVIGVDEMTA